MGVANVRLPGGKLDSQSFVRHVLRDLQALETMLEAGTFEDDCIRIGAEQEMCLVDRRTFKPAPVNTAVLEALADKPWADSELARHNLETNLSPRIFEGDALAAMRAELDEHLATIGAVAKTHNAAVCLAGVLPTLRKSDLDLANLTPRPRYRALMDAIDRHKSEKTYEIRLKGIDELTFRHDSPLIEAANTSFQVHLQVRPQDFVKYYNISQALTGPVLATAANSPLLFGRRLWHENRIALFQQALDTRSTKDHMRERAARVSFGRQWVDRSILEIYREDLARFRTLLAADITGDSVAEVEAGRVPKLLALQVNNSTVYRWNRPCYGISDNGKPHLRIENRVLPAGPTTADEIANAALWLGAMEGAAARYDDIREHLAFDDVADNFAKAAQFGMDTEFNWFGEGKVSARELLCEEIIPMAEEGLLLRGIHEADATHYMDIVRARCDVPTTGARWQLKSYTKLRETVGKDEALSNLTCAMMRHAAEGRPGHEWPRATAAEMPEYTPSKLAVEEFMETDVFTCHSDDLIDLVAEMMDWRKIRYMPVEDDDGCLCGLVTTRLMLRHHVRAARRQHPEKTAVDEIMISEPYTIGPKQTIVEAMDLMRAHKVGCLPVVKDGELLGVITEMEFLRISGRLIRQLEG